MLKEGPKRYSTEMLLSLVNYEEQWQEILVSIMNI